MSLNICSPEIWKYLDGITRQNIAQTNHSCYKEIAAEVKQTQKSITNLVLLWIDSEKKSLQAKNFLQKIDDTKFYIHLKRLKAVKQEYDGESFEVIVSRRVSRLNRLAYLITREAESLGKAQVYFKSNKNNSDVYDSLYPTLPELVEINKIFRSKEVHFDEKLFPFLQEVEKRKGVSTLEVLINAWYIDHVQKDKDDGVCEIKTAEVAVLCKQTIDFDQAFDEILFYLILCFIKKNNWNKAYQVVKMLSDSEIKFKFNSKIVQILEQRMGYGSDEEFRLAKSFLDKTFNKDNINLVGLNRLFFVKSLKNVQAYERALNLAEDLRSDRDIIESIKKLMRDELEPSQKKRKIESST